MSIRKCMIAAFAAVSLHVTSLASPVLVGTTTNPTGFFGLAVNGTNYNVVFTTQSYDTVFASTKPTFLGDESGGRDAAFALVAALRAAGVMMLGNYSANNQPVFYYDIYIPTWFYDDWGDSGITSVEIASMDRSRPGIWQAAYGGGPQSDRVLGPFGQIYSMYAVFSVSEPSTAAIACAALAALAAARKRRARKSGN